MACVKKKGGLRRQLFWSYMALVLFSMSVLCALVYWAARQDMAAQASQITGKIAGDTARMLDTGVETSERSMTFLIGNSQISAALQTEKKNYYELYQDLSVILLRQINLVRLQSTEISAVTFYTENKSLAGHSDEVRSLQEARSLPWYERASSGHKMFWVMSGENAFVVYHFIPLSSERTENYLVCTVPMDRLIDRSRFAEYEMDYFITGKAGEILRPLSARLAGSELETQALEQGFTNVMRLCNSLIDDVYQSCELQKKAHLALLHTQIKPHFLYNTLSMISWRAIQEDVPDISEIANSMADYYRTMLNGGEGETTLENEISNIGAYLEIQLAAHRHSFLVEIDVPEELLSCRMPNMVLQPLAENAVRHGVDKRQTGGGIISVSARQEESALCIEVCDNGPGMEESMCQSILQKGTGGYGVHNVQERILLYAGEGYGLFYASVPGRGTRVTVRLPVRFNTEK